MYNYSGILYRIYGVGGIILLLGVLGLLLKKPWSKGWKIQDCKLDLIIIAVSVVFIVFYVSRIFFPNISSYTGNFIKSNRNSRVAPPLPFTNEYVFWNGEGKKNKFYLDIFSKEAIFSDIFEKNQKYTIYFDKLTNIIVKVEVVD